MKGRATVAGLWLAALTLIALVCVLAWDAECYGCAAVPCFRNGPQCMGQCSCQYRDDISGVCG